MDLLTNEVILNGLRTIGIIILSPLYIIGLPLSIIEDIYNYRKRKQFDAKRKKENTNS